MTDTVTIRREILEELRDSTDGLLMLWNATRVSGCLPMEIIKATAAVKAISAALAAQVQGDAVPFAVTTGYFGGHATIRPINPAMVINSGLALYIAQPQPAEVGELVELLRAEFPLFDDEGLDQENHHCEWSVQHDRKRLHRLLAKLEGKA
jgi:hypothetical protein